MPNILVKVVLCLDEQSAVYETTVCKVFRGDIRPPVEEIYQPLVRLASMAAFGLKRSTQICGDDGMDCVVTARDVWRRQQQAAEAAYDRSSDCRFTSFIGYEYTLQEAGNNLASQCDFCQCRSPAGGAQRQGCTTP